MLASRNGAATPVARSFVQNQLDRGVDARATCADVGSLADTRRLLDEIIASGHPLKGVFHLAMVIDDAPISALTRERMKNVLDPKARGAWLLHDATRNIDLDCFVMFSSVSSIFGNPAQANYAAANAFLDALAHHRHARGLPALVINWGALGGEGYVARNERVAEFLARQGTAQLTPSEVILLLESFLNAGTTQALALRVDWAKWRQAFRSSHENPLLEFIFTAATDDDTESSGTKSDWRPKIESAAPEDRLAVIEHAVRDVVGAVLRVKPDSLRPDQPLTDLGLDSLMAVEIENSLESAVGVALPPASLMRARTITQIASLIAEHLGTTTTPKPTTTSTHESIPIDDLDLNALTDEQIDRLLTTNPVERQGKPSLESFV